jgi:hypothetical protein
MWPFSRKRKQAENAPVMSDILGDRNLFDLSQNVVELRVWLPQEIKTARDKEPDFCFDKTPFEGVAGCEPVKKKPSRVFISPVAVEWLREHRQALKAAGWTMRELYRRNRSRGLAWARVWDKMGMTATLQGEVITITFDDNGRTIKQTARPRGTVKRRQEMFDGLHHLIGKLLTVRYQELSEDGIPIFPVGVAVRDYE